MAKSEEKCRAGHVKPKARSLINESMVLDMRRRWEAGETQRSIAKSYGVAVSTVFNIVNRFIWGHVG